MPQHVQHPVVLLDLAAHISVQILQEPVDSTGGLTFGFVAEQSFLGVLTDVGRIKVRAVGITFVAAQRHQVDIHYSQPRHHQVAQRTHVGRGVDRVEYRNDQILKIRVANHDLGITSATNHSGIALTHWNHMRPLLHLVRTAATLCVRPFAQSVYSICQTAVLLLACIVAVKAAKVSAGLNES